MVIRSVSVRLIKMLVRIAKKIDLDAIVEIERLAFLDSAFSKRALSYHIVHNLVLCVEKDNRLVGYMCFSPLTKNKKRRVYSIAVHPAFQGFGVGRVLMEYGEKKSKAKTIILEVDENNSRAISLYENLGFEIFGRYDKYYGSSDALRMRKIIK